MKIVSFEFIPVAINGDGERSTKARLASFFRVQSDHPAESELGDSSKSTTNPKVSTPSLRDGITQPKEVFGRQ